MEPMGPPPAPLTETGRTRLIIRGAVQGVGFRPFVFRLATELGLHGWVSNSTAGVTVEIEGPAGARREFLLRLEAERPPHSFIHGLEAVELDPAGHVGFTIRPSEMEGEKTALVLPDIATCAECRREIFDPADRRYRYPFTNCTHCGPRYSILESLPYDRPNTSMKGFAMCPACRVEYEDPRNRRFHAQPNACPRCGPHLALWDAAGRELAQREDALAGAVRALAEGAIVAVKGLGGFHLMVRADDEAGVRRLRERKHREEKPLALMCPDLAAAETLAEIGPLEARALRAPEAPIVLCRRRPGAPVAGAVAPGNPWLGLMLPYTPLHHLLLADLGRSVVATSGNRSDEPICTDEREALTRLGDIADLFLVHNRPIVRHVDDSLVRIVLGRELVLRRARGYAPLPIRVDAPLPPLLAVGAHLKNTVALARGNEVFPSQHIGDLDTVPAVDAFERVIADLCRLYAIQPKQVMADAHPDYRSTQHARATGLPVGEVQHHHAHVLACMAENHLAPPVLGVAWDGTGYGPDGTIWGGEFLRVTASGVERVGHLRPFRLPGGEQAVKEPRRAALGLLHAVLGDGVFERRDLAPVRAFKPAELRALRPALTKALHAPLTSSVGRLFDAVASLLDLRQVARFEGQAAMDLEFAFEPGDATDCYPVELREEAPPAELSAPAPATAALAFTPPARTWVADWTPLLQALLRDLRVGTPVWQMAARFHNTLADVVVAMARRAGEHRVVLSGGCFQNKYLLERTVEALRSAGFSPYWHQRVPPNDGGIALGQAVAAARAAAPPPPPKKG